MKASRHWFYQRVSATLLLLLLPWFAFTLIGKSYPEMVAYFKMDLPKIGLFLIMLISIFHAIMGIEVILDDYVHNAKVRKIVKFLCIFFMFFGISFIFTR